MKVTHHCQVQALHHAKMTQRGDSLKATIRIKYLEIVLGLPKIQTMEDVQRLVMTE